MNIVFYGRYSCDKQGEASIEGQRNVCYEYANRNGHIIVDEYIDRATSGKTDNRPQFLRMINDSKKKKFEGIIVYQLDRFARNLFDYAIYKDVLKTNNVNLISANENIPEGSSGLFMEGVLGVFAEYFSAELSEKVTRGMQVNAEKCKSNGGITPFGYKTDKDGKYIIDEQTAPIVKEIFTKYAEGVTIKEICKSLNERGLKNAKGEPFNKNSFNTLLKNRKYMGIYIYKGKETLGGMPQIIDEDLFNRVAERMGVNKKAPARSRAKAEYLLTTKLFCGYCKEMMVGHSSNKTSKNGIIYNYYKCKNSGGSKSCKKKMVGKDYMEDLVVSECRKVLTPKNIHRITSEIVKIAKQYEDNRELKRLNELLGKTEKDSIMSALRFCPDDITREMIFEELRKIGEEIKTINNQLAIEKSKHHIVTAEQIEEFLTKLANGDYNNIAYKRTLIKVLVNKIYLYDDKFTITFNSGDEEVTITDKLLSDIEKNFDEKLCLLNDKVYQQKSPFCLLTRGTFLNDVFLTERDIHFVCDGSFGRDVRLRRVNGTHHITFAKQKHHYGVSHNITLIIPSPNSNRTKDEFFVKS